MMGVGIGKVARMDIRTRLSLALVFVSLASMSLLGAFAYTTSATLLQEISLRQLDALAESKKRDLIKVYNGWEDHLRLVRDRTQLRTSIKEYVNTGSESSLRHIKRIIAGITMAVTEIDKLIVFDVDGNEIASFGRSSIQHSKVSIGQDITHVDTFPDPDEQGGVRVALNTGVSLDDQLIGGIELIIDAAALFDVTGNYTGLGETGEAFVVIRQGDDMLQVLNPLRHQVAGPVEGHVAGPTAGSPEKPIRGFNGKFPLATVSDDIQRMFSGNKDVSAEEHTDYRGEQVWSATRYLPVLGWGLVVKVDISEEQRRARSLRKSLIEIGLALSAFAIIGGAALGIYLARPIHNLAVIVERIRHGESELRASVKGDDEIAYLAESFNQYLDHQQTEADRHKGTDVGDQLAGDEDPGNHGTGGETDPDARSH